MEENELLDLFLPREMANMRLPMPALVTYYKLLKERTLWLDSVLDIGWLEYERMIIMWNQEDKGIPIEERKPIKLMYYSPGGDLDINNSFIDVLRLSKTPTIGVNCGIAYSGGCFTFLSCQKRYMLKHASFLLHTGSADGIGGTADQVASITAHYNQQVGELKKYLVEDIGIDKKIVNKGMKGEWFINADEAMKLGIVHGIVDDIDLL